MATYKTLYLLRHAEAESQIATDHARKLTQRGELQAASIGQQLLEKQIRPASVMVSNAARTTQTAQICVTQLWPDGNNLPHIVYYQALYNCQVSAMMAAIDSLPDASAEAMIVGHNPSITEAVKQLVGKAAKDLSVGDVVALRWLTLDVNEPWVSAVSAQPTLLWHLSPAANSQL